MLSCKIGQHAGGLPTPHGLIPRCLTKIKIQAARLVLITPLWKTQLWYPIILELLEDYPRKITQQQDLVSMPVGQEFLIRSITWLSLFL